MSQLLDKAVNEFAKLPGIGRKTALRHVLYLLHCDDAEVEAFASAITTLKKEIHHCQVCHNISDTPICPICSNPKRDASTVCVVENIQDVIAIEKTAQFHGLYHVLGGLISPMDGIGPSDLEINSLCERVGEGNIREVIFALSSTMEGDTTAFYIYRKLQNTQNPQNSEVPTPNSSLLTPNCAVPLRFSCIARGISVGDELEYTDELTLGRSILNRTNYEGK